MKKKKTDARSIGGPAINALRERAISLYKRKHSMTDIADLLSVSYSAVRKWVGLYKVGKSLKTKQRGRTKGQKELTKVQEKWIKQRMIDKTPDQLKLPFTLWTREAVQKLIERQFGIRKSLPQIGRYLHEWGFSPQKPIYKAYEQNEEVVRNWIEKEYPAIKKAAAREKADIYWEDEMGMRSDHQAGRSYAPKGKTPEIKRTGKRFRLNMISAISNRGQKKFMIFKDSFNGEKFIIFLRKLVNGNKRKVFLIVDGHPAHKRLIVQNWLEKHKNKITIFFLPGYSPELNPQELMNQDIKTNAVAKHRTLNADDLNVHVTSYIQTRKREIIKSYFQHTKTKYAA